MPESMAVILVSSPPWLWPMTTICRSAGSLPVGIEPVHRLARAPRAAAWPSTGSGSRSRRRRTRTGSGRAGASRCSARSACRPSAPGSTPCRARRPPGCGPGDRAATNASDVRLLAQQVAEAGIPRAPIPRPWSGSACRPAPRSARPRAGTARPSMSTVPRVVAVVELDGGVDCIGWRRAVGVGSSMRSSAVTGTLTLGASSPSPPVPGRSIQAFAASGAPMPGAPVARAEAAHLELGHRHEVVERAVGPLELGGIERAPRAAGRTGSG